MSTSPLWTVHCDGAVILRKDDLHVVWGEQGIPGTENTPRGCHFWIGHEDSRKDANQLARACGWIVLATTALCPACAVYYKSSTAMAVHDEGHV